MWSNYKPGFFASLLYTVLSTAAALSMWWMVLSCLMHGAFGVSLIFLLMALPFTLLMIGSWSALSDALASRSQQEDRKEEPESHSMAARQPEEEKRLEYAEEYRSDEYTIWKEKPKTGFEPTEDKTGSLRAVLAVLIMAGVVIAAILIGKEARSGGL